VTTDVFLGKLATIERCLERIRVVTGGDAERVDQIDVEKIVVLNPQRAIQATIDLAAHLISGRGWGLPDSLKAHFQILADQGVLAADLALRLRAMVGFRNIAVHDYECRDRQILKRTLRERLGDLVTFATSVRSFAQIGARPDLAADRDAARRADRTPRRADRAPLQRILRRPAPVAPPQRRRTGPNRYTAHLPRRKAISLMPRARGGATIVAAAIAAGGSTGWEVRSS